MEESKSCVPLRQKKLANTNDSFASWQALRLNLRDATGTKEPPNLFVREAELDEY